MQTLKDSENEVSKSSKMSTLYRFFCWCSGARLYILKQCPSEFNKYYGIGVIVFLTGVMAIISGGYAIYTVFRDVKIAMAFGALWGFLIFSIDWYIVSSLRKQKNTFKELVMAMPRFILAILIAVVISMPLKLKLFEREIEQQILFDQQQSIIQFQQLIGEEFDEIARLEKQNTDLRREINRKEEQRNLLFKMFIEEAEGNSPTQKAGKGPVFREKRAEYDKVDAELQTIRASNTTQIERNELRLEQLNDRRDIALAGAQQTNKQSDGFLARLQAMSTLNSSSESILLASWFIILLFITIESAPIIVKLLSSRGPYDDLLEAEEYIKQVEIRKVVVQAELTEDHQIDLHSLLENERNNKLFEVEKNHIKEEAEVLTEINKMKIHKWKSEEIQKLAMEPSSTGLLGKESLEPNSSDLFSDTENKFIPSEIKGIKDIPNYDEDETLIDNDHFNIHEVKDLDRNIDSSPKANDGA